MIDTHAHLQSSDIGDVERVINEALDCGVEKIICVGYDIPSSIEAVEIAKKYKNIYAIVGVHPGELENLQSDYLQVLENLCQSKKVVAIGEIGLDYHYKPYDKVLQSKVFVEQINLANKLKLPICIHSRDATGDLVQILKDNEHLLNNAGVLHCFGESFGTFNIIKKYNFKISIGGVLTYKNAKNVQEVISKIPMEYIMLETDCPWLTPEPFRGKEKNQPKYVGCVCEKLAELKGITKEEAEKITTNNAINLFKFKD